MYAKVLLTYSMTASTIFITVSIKIKLEMPETFNGKEGINDKRLSIRRQHTYMIDDIHERADHIICQQNHVQTVRESYG